MRYAIVLNLVPTIYLGQLLPAKTRLSEAPLFLFDMQLTLEMRSWLRCDDECHFLHHTIMDRRLDRPITIPPLP